MDPEISDDYLEPYESLFARDLEGRLIRMEKATRDDFSRPISVTIDGIPVKGLFAAVPDTDDQGNVRLDENRHAIPRRTTVYDAANKAYTVENDTDPVPRNRNPIPILCHQEHLKPAGLCRVCSILVVKTRKKKDGTIQRDVSSKLEPACHHPVVDGMEIHTARSTEMVLIPGTTEPQPAGEYVRKAVAGLLQLLGGDHLHADQAAGDRRYHNELLTLAEAFDLCKATPGSASAVVRSTSVPLVQASYEADAIASSRIPLQTPFFRKERDASAVDASSRIIRVDHNQCILCDRCVRACSEVRPFKIIGHTGYGNKARISFDLNSPMGESECVACGECAITCPTGALAFKGTVYDALPRGRSPWDDMQPAPVTVPAEDFAQIVARYAQGAEPVGDVPARFAGLPEPILQRLASLFAQISYAFLKWNEGAIGLLDAPARQVLCRKGEYGSAAYLILDGEIRVEGTALTLTSDDIIVGEMACMSNTPRTATLTTATPARVLVIRRNVLHALQRNKIAKTILHQAYRDRAVSVRLGKGALFEGLTPEQNKKCVEYLRARRDKIRFVEADPGQVLVRQGEPADFFYIIHRGRVQISKTGPAGQQVAHNYQAEGRHVGEMGLMSDPEVSPRFAATVPEEIRGKRTATCIALDHVELVRIDKELFRGLLAIDDAIRVHFEAVCEKLWAHQPNLSKSLQEFNRQGLHEGQSLLVLDLNKCTRCQECVKGCADAHGGVTRLVLEGERYDHFLIPSACRSCHDPVCLIGCPVDSIHRRPNKRGGKNDRFAIVIEDWCIGCGLCAYNCPFGSIHMHALPEGRLKAEGPRREATNCDLCEPDHLGGVPRCVHSCPHDAAHRMHGETFAALLGMPVLAGVRED